jgi:hypothetical protein
MGGRSLRAHLGLGGEADATQNSKGILRSLGSVLGACDIDEVTDSQWRGDGVWQAGGLRLQVFSRETRTWQCPAEAPERVWRMMCPLS